MPLHALADLSNASQVATAGLANDAVTYAKMQNVSVENKLIGRGAGAFGGDPEEIGLGFGLTMAATTLSVDSAEAATASTIAKRDIVGGLTCTVITAPNGASFGNVTSSGTRTFSTGTTWVYGSGLALLHAQTLVPAYVAVQTLTDAATITYNAALGNNAKVTLTADRTLAAITNAAAGASGTLWVIQNGTGGWALTLDATQRDLLGTLADIGTMAASAVAVVAWTTRDGTNFDLFITTP